MLVFMTYNVRFPFSPLAPSLPTSTSVHSQRSAPLTLHEPQAYLIASVVIGAALGHYVFGGTLNPDAVLNDGGQDKGMACH